MDCPLCPEIGAGCGHSPPISHVDLVIILLTKISADTQKYTENTKTNRNTQKDTHKNIDKHSPPINQVDLFTRYLLTNTHSNIHCWIHRQIHPISDTHRLTYIHSDWDTQTSTNMYTQTPVKKKYCLNGCSGLLLGLAWKVLPVDLEQPSLTVARHYEQIIALCRAQHYAH